MKNVKLLKPHTDAGRDYPEGAELSLDDSNAQWLISLKVAEEVTIPKATESKVSKS